jgi:outer membrane protein OmpA-like peptidoglycan-associated protein
MPGWRRASSTNDNRLACPAALRLAAQGKPAASRSMLLPAGRPANTETRSKLMKLQRTTIALTATLVLLGGCANMSQEQQDTAKGAGIGAVGGAVIGGLIGGKSGAAAGAAIGGVGGAVAGNIWSKKMQDKQAAMEQSTKGTGIDVSRTPDNQLKVNVPSDSGFAVGKADVQPQLRTVLDSFSSGLTNDPNMLITVIGHTDSSGTDAINNPLSVNRAQSVKDYLVSRGVPASRIAIAGEGSRQPVADNSTAAGRAQNRRVEIFLREPQAPAKT